MGSISILVRKSILQEFLIWPIYFSFFNANESCSQRSAQKIYSPYNLQKKYYLLFYLIMKLICYRASSSRKKIFVYIYVKRIPFHLNCPVRWTLNDKEPAIQRSGQSRVGSLSSWILWNEIKTSGRVSCM